MSRFDLIPPKLPLPAFGYDQNYAGHQLALFSAGCGPIFPSAGDK